jgi:acetate kinase
VRILVVNAGSSSLKLRVLDDDDRITDSADLPASRGVADHQAAAAAIGSFGDVDAVGHRIVHGGTRFTGPVIIDAEVRKQLDALTDLAPLHQPQSLAAVDAVQAVLDGRGKPAVPAVACFDTAFHATIGPAAATYALPSQWRQRWDLRRFGFHGLSHAYCSRRAAQLLGADAGALRVVTCHLGAGASLAAVRGGRSADTTMGFTPLEGLVMATRSGSVDPGLLLWLEEHAGTPPSELAATLEHRSGLLGLAGTADMREILDLAARGDGSANQPAGPDGASEAANQSARPGGATEGANQAAGPGGASGAARAALEVYLHRLRGSIAAMAAAMDGLDALVFTGGVGENSAEVRSRAATGLAFLGIGVDDGRNVGGAGDREIGAPGASVRVLVIAAREDIEIARQVRTLL